MATNKELVQAYKGPITIKASIKTIIHLFSIKISIF